MRTQPLILASARVSSCERQLIRNLSLMYSYDSFVVHDDEEIEYETSSPGAPTR